MGKNTHDGVDYQPWQPITRAIDLKHLGKLGEELGEAGAAVSRCIIQGLDGVEPETGKLNRAWLEDELADVMANLQLVTEHFGLDIERMNARVESKLPRLRKWHGMLADDAAAPEEPERGSWPPESHLDPDGDGDPRLD